MCECFAHHTYLDFFSHKTFSDDVNITILKFSLVSWYFDSSASFVLSILLRHCLWMTSMYASFHSVSYETDTELWPPDFMACIHPVPPVARTENVAECRNPIRDQRNKWHYCRCHCRCRSRRNHLPCSRWRTSRWLPNYTEGLATSASANWRNETTFAFRTDGCLSLFISGWIQATCIQSIRPTI